LVGHLTQPLPPAQAGIYPRHFGLIYPGLEDWAALEQRAIERGLTFQQQSKRRFTGDITEHYSFFLVDPFSNLLEFKHYLHSAAIFGTREFDRIGDALP
jgi:uncharacterized protein